jgi:hypothetical protein
VLDDVVRLVVVEDAVGHLLQRGRARVQRAVQPDLLEASGPTNEVGVVVVVVADCDGAKESGREGAALTAAITVDRDTGVGAVRVSDDLVNLPAHNRHVLPGPLLHKLGVPGSVWACGCAGDGRDTSRRLDCSLGASCCSIGEDSPDVTTTSTSYCSL